MSDRVIDEMWLRGAVCGPSGVRRGLFIHGWGGERAPVSPTRQSRASEGGTRWRSTTPGVAPRLGVGHVHQPGAGRIGARGRGGRGGRPACSSTEQDNRVGVRDTARDTTAAPVAARQKLLFCIRQCRGQDMHAYRGDHA